MNINASDLKLTGLKTANVPTIAEFNYAISTMTATWRFNGLIANDIYLIWLSDAITDIEGNRLDGERINPASITSTNSLISHFPSGDGSAGGDFNFVITLLAGDPNLDNISDDNDAELWKEMKHAGITFPVFTHADVNGDGFVNSTDKGIINLNYWIDLQKGMVLGRLGWKPNCQRR